MIYKITRFFSKGGESDKYGEALIGTGVASGACLSSPKS